MTDLNERNSKHVLEVVEETVSGMLYKDQNGKHFVISGYPESGLTIYTASSDCGEPIDLLRKGLVIHIGERVYHTVEVGVLEETPQSIAANPRQPTRDEKFRYMMLSRLQSDCKYFLGYGRRNLNHLPSNNVDAHIAHMKNLWNSFPDDGKPEWLTWEQIKQYESDMKKDKVESPDETV